MGRIDGGDGILNCCLLGAGLTRHVNQYRQTRNGLAYSELVTVPFLSLVRVIIRHGVRYPNLGRASATVVVDVVLFGSLIRGR